MTNIELLRNAKPGDKFRKGNGDVLEVVEVPEFYSDGSPTWRYGKMLVNGVTDNWRSFEWYCDTTNPSHGLTRLDAPAPTGPTTSGLPRAAEVMIALGRLTREQWDAAGKL